MKKVLLVILCFTSLFSYSQMTVSKCYNGPQGSYTNTTGTALGFINLVSGVDFPAGAVIVDVEVEIVWSKTDDGSCTAITGSSPDLSEVGFAIQGPIGGPRIILASNSTGPSVGTSASFIGSTNVNMNTTVIKTGYPPALLATPNSPQRDTVGPNGDDLLFYNNSSPAGLWSIVAIDDAPSSGPALCIHSYCITITYCSSTTSPNIPVINTPNTICAGDSSLLSWSGNLNDASQWKLYTNSCGGTLVDSTATNSVFVKPIVTTTYYIRGEGSCVTPGLCDSITIYIDTTKPTVVCQDINVYLDGSGNVSIVAADVDGGSTDNCSGITLSVSKTSFACSDKQAPLNSLIITGVYDGPLVGGTPKGVELYVLNDIADLSQYGLGSANNGGGTDGEEFTFSAVSVTAGSYIHVTSDSARFTQFFGLVADYTSGAVLINGDDAVELFHSGNVIDVFGDINVDGTNQVWDYLDGWGYRKSNTGNDNASFMVSNWNYSGKNALDGESDNATAATPFPLGSYTNLAWGVSVTLTATDGNGNIDSCIAIVSVFDTINRNDTITDTVCDSVMFAGKMLIASGSYNDTIITSGGCDSITTLELIVNYTIRDTITDTVCDSVIFAGEMLIVSGSYNDTIITSGKCDSITTLELIVNYTIRDTITDTICDSVMFSGEMLIVSGSYNDTLVAVSTCDSIVTLQLTVINIDSSISISGLTLTANESGRNYQWIDCNNANSPVIGEINQVYTVTVNGDYAVIISDSNNICSDTSACVTVATVNVKTLPNDLQIDIYPNPSLGIFNISIPNLVGKTTVTVRDVLGKVILAETTATRNMTISLSKEKKGIYTVVIKNKSSYTVKKVILK